MKKFMNQDDVVDVLNQKTGFYKKDLRIVMDALEETLVEYMTTATQDKPSEIRLFHGWKIGAKLTPERAAKDPRNGADIITPEKLIPYCRFETTLKQKLNSNITTQED